MKRILVIGDVMIDHYVYGSVERISPEAPVPILDVDKEEAFLGGAGVVAENLKNLGAEVSFISVIGDDDGAVLVKKFLAASGIGNSLAMEKQRKSTLKKRFIATSPYFQMLLRADNETRADVKAATEAEIIRNIRAQAADIIVLSDYNKGMMTKKVIAAAIAAAKEKGGKVIVDTKKNIHDYKGAYLVAPNVNELCIAMGMRPDNSDEVVRDNALRLATELGSIVVVKRGAKGASIVDGNGMRTYPSEAKEIVNVSGAGDIFLAIVALAIASGKSADDAVKLANRGCGRAIARRHPSVTKEDLR